MGALISLGLGVFGAVCCIGGTPGAIAVGFAAMAASVLLLRLTPGVWSQPLDPAPSRHERMCLLVVFAALLFFRFYRMEPPGLWGDDALNGMLAFDVLDGRIGSPFQIIQHSHSRFHALTNYVIAGSFLLFGADLPALRMPGLLASCAAGLFVYGIARRSFGEPTALLTGLFFAAAPMQIAHAKSLTQVVLGLSLQTAGIYALLRAVEGRSGRWLIAAAPPLAATIYTYHAAKIAPLVALPLLFAARRGRAFSRRDWTAAALVFVACLIPAAVSFWNEPLALFGRAQAVSIIGEVRQAGSPWPLIDSLAKTLGIFHVEQGPQYNWFGPGGDPALTPVVAALVLHGLVASIIGWRQPRNQLLLFWFALGMAPAVLSTEAPRGYRTLMATPPLFVWAAMPLAALWRADWGSGGTKRINRALVAVTVVVSLFFDFNYYFHRVYTHPRSRWTLGERIVEMARIARQRGHGWTAYIMSPTFTAKHESLQLLARMWSLDIRDAPSIHYALDESPLPARGAVFLTNPGSHEAGEIIQRQLPRARRIARRDPASAMWPWGGSWPYETILPRRPPIAVGIVAPRQSMQTYRKSHRPMPIEVSCESESGNSSWREPVPFYYFFSDTFDEPSRCTWHGALRVPPAKSRELRFYSNQELAVTIDGKPYHTERPLPPGRHDVTIATEGAARHIELKVMWKGPKGDEQIVPLGAWLAPRAPAHRQTPAWAPPSTRSTSPDTKGAHSR